MRCSPGCGQCSVQMKEKIPYDLWRDQEHEEATYHAAGACNAVCGVFLNSDLSEDYTSAWKVSGGSFGGAVTQEDGYVSIVKGDDKTVSSPTGGAYTWLVPQSLTLPESGKLTAEVTLRAGAAVDADKYGEISVRFGKNANDTNGKLYPRRIRTGQAPTRWTPRSGIITVL